jgi:cell division protein FtsW
MPPAARPKTRRTPPDPALLFLTVLLMLFGLIMVFSASANMAEARFGSPYLFLRKQLVWDVLGGIALYICMRTDYHKWQKWSYALLGAAAASLALVLMVGRVVKGARRWIQFAGFTFQPSELAKIALILWLANYLDRRKSQLKDFRKGFLPPLVVIGLILVLILKEPDLGTPMLLASVSMIMLFLAGARWKHMASVTALSMIPLYYELTRVGYRQRRLLAFADPWANASGAGYQLTQSLVAFGSGGLFGKGLGASTLKLLALPDPHTDFIFPVIGEELGFVGAVSLIFLFVLWGLRGWKVAQRAPDLFGQLLAAGITSWVLIQASINMGVSCGLLPTKGLPLPFVSFGGSSLVITMMAVGILLNISAQGRAERTQDIRSLRERR